jgi:NAD+ synthase (glutamine-hydrolysing)
LARVVPGGGRNVCRYSAGMPRLRIAGCQLNTRVGDLDGNVALILDALGRADEADCDLAVFPELAITGYPPEDLLLKPGFIADVQQAVRTVAAATKRCVAVFGFVDADRDLYNAAAVCANGEVVGVYHKRELPNYAVFDELRYFARGPAAQQLYRIGGVTVGVSICEDSWNPNGPIADQADSGAELVVNLNASPYAAGKLCQRERMLATRAADASCALVYVNQVGGQDELVFDGASMVFDADGELLARAPQFVEDVMICDVDVEPVYRKRLLDPRGRATGALLPVNETTATERRPSDHTEPRPPAIVAALHPDDEIYEALVVGTRDYLQKNGFSDVVIGLSGGIDSSLVAVIAVDALGADRVHGVSMPSRYSSDHSRSDAEKLAVNLGIDFRTIAIEPAHAAFLELLAPSFGDRPADLTEENLQSRIRGMTLMALSNKFGWIVLCPGNKSEMAVGYATLYGDTVGGFAVLKDVYKTREYQLCRRRNGRAGYDLIPEATIAKPPSAELRPDQRDDQSLPPYELLDPILEQYIEHDRTGTALIEAGADPDLVARVVHLVDTAEYKRRQTPPGVRVSVKAFGKDRRLPITNSYRFHVEKS